MGDLCKVTINGADYEVPADYTIMQACEEAVGVEIPRFCYHERLSIAGNCRMCLVEWVGAPKPQASCALQIKDLRPNRDGSPAHIRTDSDIVKKARQGVMEFLLINHPLDCPICDQGGECDLQDQAMAYGRDGTRFSENKRAVDDKYMGPLVNTIMTRCIQCTRCVRFITEVAGVEEIGMVGRGEDAQITTYLEKALVSELSGNVIDLCPVGALTSKPYAFNARPWELEKVASVDVMDALGANIRVDSRDGKVLRVLPVSHDGINEEWISDKTRFACDGLSRQRLDRPYIRENGRLRIATWDEALAMAGEKLRGNPARIAALAGDLCDVESMKALLDLLDNLGVKHRDCRQDGSILAGPRCSYLFNSHIQAIEQADAVLIIGADPRFDAPLINSRIRKSWLYGKSNIGLIGPACDLTYSYTHLGHRPEDIGRFTRARSGFAAQFKRAERPMLILGSDVFTRTDSYQIMSLIAALVKKFKLIRPEWNGYNVLHKAAARVGGLDLGFLPAREGLGTQAILAAARAGELDTVYLLGADEIDMTALENTFVIYQGHHGDAGAHVADVILPAAAYTEKDGLYVNLEGRVQTGMRAVPPKGQAREDWAIIRALSAHAGQTLPYDSLVQLREKLFEDYTQLASIDHVQLPDETAFDLSHLCAAGAPSDQPFAQEDRNFYLTNVIARASETMAQCAKIKPDRNQEQSKEDRG